MKLQKSLCFLVRRQRCECTFLESSQSRPPLHVAKPEDADKPTDQQFRLQAIKPPFTFLWKLTLEREPSSVDSSVLAASKSQSLEPLPRSR